MNLIEDLACVLSTNADKDDFLFIHAFCLDVKKLNEKPLQLEF